MTACATQISLWIEPDPFQSEVIHCRFEPTATPAWLERFACVLSAHASVLGTAFQRVNLRGVTLRCDEPEQEHFVEAAGWCANHANHVTMLRSGGASLGSAMAA